MKCHGPFLYTIVHLSKSVRVHLNSRMSALCYMDSKNYKIVDGMALKWQVNQSVIILKLIIPEIEKYPGCL